MGISVYDQAPDAETLLMSENAPVASNDDDVEDEAEAALTTVDSDSAVPPIRCACICAKWARSSC